MNTNPKTKYSIPRWVILLIGLPFICASIVGISYWFIELRPQHLELNFPLMPGMSKSNVSEYGVWMLNRERDYLWRQTAICSPIQCSNWNTIIAHFDDWLIHEGWERIGFGNPCYSIMPEARFLEMNKIDGYVAYQLDETDNLNPAICIAAWPDEEYYEIVVMTRNSSPITQLYNSWD
jgi:hypothetical protein